MKNILIVLITILSVLILFFLFKQSKAHASARLGSGHGAGKAPEVAGYPPSRHSRGGILERAFDGFVDLAKTPAGQDLLREHFMPDPPVGDEAK